MLSLVCRVGAVGRRDVRNVQLADLGGQVASTGKRATRWCSSGVAAGSRGRQLDPVLDEPARRRLGPRRGRVGLLGRPGRPGLVGLADVAGADLDARSTCPPGTSALQVKAPNRLGSLASWTSETSSPWRTKPGDSRTTEPGSPVPRSTPPSGSASSARIWPLSSFASGRALVALVADLVKLPVGSGADEQPVARPGRGRRSAPWRGRPRGPTPSRSIR